MVYQTYGLHVSPFMKKTEITKTAKTTETTQTASNKELSAGLAQVAETTDMKTTGIQGANHGFPIAIVT